MEKEQTSNYELIQKFYTGKISVKEETELYNALQNDKNLKRKFFEFENDYDFPMDQLTKDYWHKLISKRYNRSDNQLKKQRIIYAGLKYAAIFLIGCFSFWFQQNIVSNKPNYEVGSYCELVVPKGQKSQLHLPDGTTVWLNSESTLRYPANFLQTTRWVELSGEAFFDVTKNNGQSFIVKTNEFDIKVTGTKFNVMAYEDFNRTEAFLEEGRIEILNNKGKGNGEIAELVPNQKFVFSKEKHDYTITRSNPQIESSWKHNEFVFEDIEFSEFAKRLGRWYDVEITVEDEELSKIRYTGKFKNKETIWQVLDIIKLTTKIEYTLKDRKLTIMNTR